MRPPRFWPRFVTIDFSGPTMSLDAPPCIYRWRHAREVTGEGTTEEFHWRGDDIEPTDLEALGFVHEPHALGRNHAESISFLDAGRERLIVAYDAPSEDRLAGDARLIADVVTWR